MFHMKITSALLHFWSKYCFPRFRLVFIKNPRYEDNAFPLSFDVFRNNPMQIDENLESQIMIQVKIACSNTDTNAPTTSIAEWQILNS
mmetsp:Transcript_2202/g.4635  ORF Transcript_2202/g.4635 Transcript_2202/m.4635 type:complete len:88 (+) Transcript_2202:1111-1374(+)